MIVIAICLVCAVLAQDKGKPKQSMFDQPFQPAISYIANGGIGMRWSKHYFENPYDMQFIDGQTHLDESRERRLTNLRIQTDHESVSVDGTSQAVEKPPVYLSHIYYTPRLDTFDIGTYGVASAQNGILPFSGQDSNTCTQPEHEEINLTKEVIRSNRQKMGLGQYGTREEQNVLRSSALMSHAFNWTPSVELPIEKIEQNENEQLIEAFFAKMAKTHNIENFNHFQALLSRWKNAADRPNYWTSFYTVDQPLHPVSKLGGILEGVQAIDITRLSKSKSPEAFAFFRERILVQPNYITFNQISILLPEQRKFVITNVQKQGDIQIENVLTCSPELTVYLPKNQYYPIILSPGQTITLTVIVAPETWGLLQTAIIVSFSNMLNLMLPVTSFHIANDYELEPIYFTNVNVGEQVQGQIRIKNPSAVEEVEILEVYSSEEYLKLYWPNSVPLASSSEAQSNRDFSKYLKIEPGAKAKQVLTYKFQTDQVVDHRAVIHMVTSLGDVIRIPLYFHVYPDLFKFTPSIVDFGLVAYRFDALRVPVSVSIRNGFDIGMLYLSEVLLPVSESRLDFVMGRWDRDSIGNIQIYNKHSMRLEEQRRGLLHKDRTLELFTLILNPTSFGEINTSILLVFTTEEGKEFRVELPVIGHVMKQNNLLLEDSFGNGSPNFQPQSVAKPAITLNVKPYINDNLMSPQLLKSKRVEERLIIVNNLGASLKGFEVIEMFPEAVFAYQSGSSSKQTGSSKSAELQVGQSLQLGSFYINTKDLKTTAGRFYFFLQTNANLFVPMAVQIIDQNLICSYIPLSMSPTRHQDCQSGVALDFKQIALNQAVSKYLNVTNIGSEPVSIDWISTTGDNEVFINFLQIDPSAATDSKDFVLGSYRGQGLDHQKKRINGMLQPGQTVTIEIGVEAYISTAQTSTKKATFQFNPPTYGQLKVDITFTAMPGTAYFSPKKPTIKFQSTYLGAAILPTEVINFSSKQLGLVCIRTVSVDNPHFKVVVVNSKLKDKSEVLRISFDPNDQRLVQSAAVAIKNQSDNSIVLQRVTNQELPAAQQKSQASSKFVGITKADVSKYRQSQQQLYQSRKKTESTVVTGTLRIETDMMKVVEYKLEAEIVQPTIISENSIDFGTVQIGSSTMRSLTVSNPFSEPLQVQLYVGRTTSEIEAELRRLKLMANEKKINSILDNRNHVQESIFQTLNYTRFFCARQKEMKLMEFSDDEPIHLKRDSSKLLACKQVIDLLEFYDSIDQFNKDKTLWSNIEEYFRQIILVNTNFESNLNLETISKDQLETLGLLSQLEQLVQTLVFQSDQNSEENSVQSVDQQIVTDLTYCTQQKPHLSVNQSHYEDITSQLGFPNALDYYLPIRPNLKFALNTLTAPFRWLYHLVNHFAEQETWLDCFAYTMQSASSNLSELLVLFKRQQMQPKPEEYLIARIKDKNYLPAATTTNQIQFLDSIIHKELVKNYGTLGAERNVQSFFLNQKYNKVITIPPNSSVVLTNAITYEPKVYINGESQTEMLLYIKTDHTPLQTLRLKGNTGSALLEITSINKISQGANQQVFSNPHYTSSSCNDKYKNGSCKNTSSVKDYVAQQIFGRSTLTPQIQLKIDVKDALGSVEREQMHRIAASNFFTRIKTFLVQAYSQVTHHHIAQGPDLPKEYRWVLVFTNIGNQNWRPTKFGFEDPKTGEISCKMGDLELTPCHLNQMQQLDQQSVELILHADYSTVTYKKTLVFESASHIQRFPLSLNTDLRLLDFASQFDRTNAWQSEFVRSISLLVISLLLLIYKQILKIRSKPKSVPKIIITEPAETAKVATVQLQPDKPEKPKEQPQKPETQIIVESPPIAEKVEVIDVKAEVEVEVVKVKKDKPSLVSRMNKKERKAFEQRKKELEMQEQQYQVVDNSQQEDTQQLESQQLPMEQVSVQVEQPQATIPTLKEESVDEVISETIEQLQESVVIETDVKVTDVQETEVQSEEQAQAEVAIDPIIEEAPMQLDVQVEPVQTAEEPIVVKVAPKPKVYEKVKAPKPAKEPHYRPVDRSIDHKSVDYNPKKQFHHPVTHQQQWRQPVKERPTVEPRSDPYDYSERKPEPKMRDYVRPIRRHEDQYYYEQELYHKHAYHRNRDWHYDDEVDYAPEQNDYFDEYHQERYEPKQDLPQYQSVPKRQYWQEPQKQYKSFQKQYQPNYADKNSFAEKSVYNEKPSYFEKHLHAEMPVYGEKPLYSERLMYPEHKSMKVPQKPMTVGVQQIQQSLWKPKTKADLSRLEPEEEVKQRPVSNFYNAFKSIQTMFNQKAVVVQSRTNSQDREEKPSFRESIESELQPRFSLFGDPIWGNDTPQQEPKENKVWFKPLRQYNNTMFTDSLESLKKPEPQGEEKYKLF